jgi:hypothetical protein
MEIDLIVLLTETTSKTEQWIWADYKVYFRTFMIFCYFYNVPCSETYV